jgi:hypothetical protein
LWARQHAGTGRRLILVWEDTVRFRHATVLVSVSNEKNNAKRYPGSIMNPYTGQYEDVEFYDGLAKIWDYTVQKDAYLVISISPVPEPCSLVLLGGGVVALIAHGAAKARKRQGDMA